MAFVWNDWEAIGRGEIRTTSRKKSSNRLKYDNKPTRSFLQASRAAIEKDQRYSILMKKELKGLDYHRFTASTMDPHVLTNAISSTLLVHPTTQKDVYEMCLAELLGYFLELCPCKVKSVHDWASLWMKQVLSHLQNLLNADSEALIWAYFGDEQFRTKVSFVWHWFCTLDAAIEQGWGQKDLSYIP